MSTTVTSNLPNGQVAQQLDAAADSAGETGALARLTPDEARRVELVDLANAIRPRTLT